MKRICVITMAVIVSASLLALSCSAADVFVADSFDYWTGGTYSWSIEPSGSEYNFVASSYESALDWSNPFPDNELVRKGYVSTINQGIKLESISEPPASFYNYHLTINFGKLMNFVAGQTYTFFIRCSSLEVFNSDGTASTFVELLNRVCFEDANGTLNDMTLSRSSLSNWSDVTCVTYKPSSNKSASMMYFYFTNSGSLATFQKVKCSLTFSNVVSYTGDLQYVEANPKLDSINDQVKDINDAIHNNPYGEITGSHPDDPFETLDEQNRIDAGDDILNRIELFLEGIPANVSTFWKQVVEFLFALPIFLPFITLGVGFIFMRMLLGR